MHFFCIHAAVLYQHILLDNIPHQQNNWCVCINYSVTVITYWDCVRQDFSLLENDKLDCEVDMNQF